jgi:hypothetical protein
MPRRAYIESYGPELLQALLKGSRTTVKLTTTYRRGVVFRRRLNELRSVMREQKHPLAPVVARAKVELEYGRRAGRAHVPERQSSRNVRYPVDPNVPAVITIKPHDSEFRDQLIAAGVPSGDLTSDPLEEIGTEPGLEEILEDFDKRET